MVTILRAEDNPKIPTHVARLELSLPRIEVPVAVSVRESYERFTRIPASLVFTDPDGNVAGFCVASTATLVASRELREDRGELGRALAVCRRVYEARAPLARLARLLLMLVGEEVDGKLYVDGEEVGDPLEYLLTHPETVDRIAEEVKKRLGILAASVGGVLV